MEATVEDRPGTLMQKTKELLNETETSMPQIYRDTGISYYWIRKFKAGEIANPSVNTIQRLYEYLTGKKLLTE